MSFIKNSPQIGEQIKSLHIRNIEDYITPLMFITLSNGDIITGVVKINAGQNVAITGNATDGITLMITGSVGGSSSLTGLVDTNATGAINGDLLIRQNGYWIPFASGNINTTTLSSQALYTNLYVGLLEGIMVTDNYNMKGSYIKVSNKATTGTVTFNIYKNDLMIITGAILLANTYTLDSAFVTSLIKGDIIKFEVASINTTYSVGNPVFFNIYSG